MLKADGHEFAVFITQARAATTRGTLLLIPGDGSHLTSSAAGLEQIRQSMPAHGWATWLLTLEPPPRTHAEQIDTPGLRRPLPRNPHPPARRRQRSTPGAPTHWSRAVRSQARILAAIASAAAEGRPLVLVAGGSAAVLLTRGVGNAPGSVRVAALLDPVELPGLVLQWPKGLARPVLEVLSPIAGRAGPAGCREQAAALQLKHYRQLTLEAGAWHPGPLDAPRRRVRGWLTTLEATRTQGQAPVERGVALGVPTSSQSPVQRFRRSAHRYPRPGVAARAAGTPGRSSPPAAAATAARCPNTCSAAPPPKCPRAPPCRG